MRISFDLDDTLILSGDGNSSEPPQKWLLGLFVKERLRTGTVGLCNRLVSLGFKICVYTTSERSVRYIRRLFKAYEIGLDKVVNLQIHQDIVQGGRKEILPSKVPSRFGIDLHVDDDITVKENGQQYGFRVLLIDKDDRQWSEKVLQEATRLAKKGLPR